MTLEGYINNLYTQLANIRFPIWKFKWRTLYYIDEFIEWDNYMSKWFGCIDRREKLLSELSKIKSGDTFSALEKIREMNKKAEKSKIECQIKRLKKHIDLRKSAIKTLERELEQLERSVS